MELPMVVLNSAQAKNTMCSSFQQLKWLPDNVVRPRNPGWSPDGASVDHFDQFRTNRISAKIAVSTLGLVKPALRQQ